MQKYRQGFILNSICILPTLTVAELLDLKEKCGFSGFPVTENGQIGSKLLGIVTLRDVDFLKPDQLALTVDKVVLAVDV